MKKELQTGTTDEQRTEAGLLPSASLEQNGLLSASAVNKGNHRWKDNICVHCGCKRTKKTFKYLMAITDFPPYDHYLYEQGYIYETGEETTRERPFCPGRSNGCQRPGGFGQVGNRVPFARTSDQ